MSVFDAYAAEYDSWYDKNPFSFLSEIKAIRQVLPQGRGIEIGAGSGRFARALGVKWAVEPSLAMARLCRTRQVKVAAARAEALPFIPGFFDFALLVTSFCFFKEPLASLQEAYRVLSPRGCIILGLIDGESFLGKAYRRKKSKFYEEAHFYSAAAAVHLVEKAGFKFKQACQTLFSEPAALKAEDKVEEGFGRGGFAVICACKP